MAQVIHTGDGDVSNTNNLGYSFTFPALSESEVQVSVNNQGKTVNVDYTIHNFTQAGNSNAYILFLSTTARGTGNVRIFRQTDGNSLEHTFQAGSAIKADDLNKSNQQVLYLAEEARESVNNLALGNSGSAIQISGSNIANNSITTDKILNLEVKTADLDNQSVTTEKIKDSTGTTDGVTTAKIANLNVTTEKIANDAVTYPKLQNIQTANRVLGKTTTGEVEEVQITTDMLAANIVVDGSKIAMGSDALGDILYYDGSNYVRLPKGSPGQILSIDSYNKPAWIYNRPDAYSIKVTDTSTITMTAIRTWYDTPLTVSVNSSENTDKFVISAYLCGEFNYGYTYPFEFRIKAEHVPSPGQSTAVLSEGNIEGVDDAADSSGVSRIPVIGPPLGFEAADNKSTQETFIVPNVLHSPNLAGSGVIKYTLQVMNTGQGNSYLFTGSNGLKLYVNRSVYDKGQITENNHNHYTDPSYTRNISWMTVTTVA